MTDNNNNNQQQQPESTQASGTGEVTQNHPQQEAAPNRNPITTEEVNKKLQDIANDQDRFKRFQEQLAIKYRTEMQGYEYTPTEEFKDHPNLQPTNLENNKTSQANSNLGETELNVNNDNTNLAAQAAALKAQNISIAEQQQLGQQDQNQLPQGGQTQIGQNAGSQAQYNIEAVQKAQNAATNQTKPSKSIKG